MAEKLGQGRGRRGGGTGGNGRALAKTDNRTPEQIAEERKQQENAEAIQLLSVVARVKAQDAKVDKAKDALKVETDARNGIFLNAKAGNPLFTRGRIRELVEDSKPKLRVDVTQSEAVRARFRRIMGLPVGDMTEEQRTLDERLPDVEREGAFWFSAGHSAGLSGDSRDAPEACVRAGHDNRFDEGWRSGQAVLMVNKIIAKEGGPPLKPPALAPKPAAAPTAEETAAQRKAREKAEEVKAAEGLKGMAAAKGETPAPAAAPPLDDVQASVKAATESDCFSEATPEELAAQTTRGVVQEVREHSGQAEPTPAGADAADNEAV